MRKLLWIFVLCLFLVSGCENWGMNRYQKKLKILNSFSQDMILSRIWLDIFSEFQRKNKDINAMAMNIEPRYLLYRLKRMMMLESLPNVLYMKADSLAAGYLIQNNLLQNLRAEQQSGNLSQLKLFPAALTPQGYGENTLWFLPLTINIANVLFVNEQLLSQEGLIVPASMEELEQSIALLRTRGYEYPLLAHSSYVENILHNLLATLIARSLGPNFLYRAIKEPKLFKSSEFRAVLEEYTSYLQEDGILPPTVRNLEAGSSLQRFNLGESAFMLADPDVSEFFVGGESGEFRKSILWKPLPIKEELIDSKKELIAAGHIEPGYGITSLTSFSLELQRQAIEFINFMFLDGIKRYEKEDASFTIFSVPLQNSVSSKKQDFYRSRSFIINDIKARMLPGEYESLMGTIEGFLNGTTTLDRVVSLFHNSAMRHNLYEANSRINASQ